MLAFTWSLCTLLLYIIFSSGLILTVMTWKIMWLVFLN